MSEIPTIRLAGRDWPVPTLAPRQNRIVVPALFDLVPKIRRACNESGFAGFARHFDTAAFDALSEIAFLALTRAHPEMSRAEFDDMPIDTLELLAAVRIIARQAGLFRREPSPP